MRSCRRWEGLWWLWNYSTEWWRFEWAILIQLDGTSSYQPYFLRVFQSLGVNSFILWPLKMIIFLQWANASRAWLAIDSQLIHLKFAARLNCQRLTAMLVMKLSTNPLSQPNQLLKFPLLCKTAILLHVCWTDTEVSVHLLWVDLCR